MGDEDADELVPNAEPAAAVGVEAGVEEALVDGVELAEEEPLAFLPPLPPPAALLL